jgi:RimJ/RimL family protein N-acetyltransferase
MLGGEHEEVALDPGLTIFVRPIRADDKRLIERAFDHLSPESRFRRFFAPLERLTSRDLSYLAEVDHHDHEAIVAVNPENGAIVGDARYVRSDDPTEAEVAVIVGDPWQGHGVATVLLERLVERARAEGIDHFVALVMSDNDEAIEVFRHLAPGSKLRRSASGHTEILIDLPEPGRLSESRLGRLLSAAARGVSITPWRLLRERIGRRASR